MFYLEHFGLTDPGKVRENNEDSLLVGEGEDETLFAVADGVGGFEAGEVASRMAVDVLKKMTVEDSFEDVVKEANRRIRAASQGDERLSGMGTTMVAIRFGGTKQKPVAEIAHVGDARAYLLRSERFRPLTEDHSLVAELVRGGEITRAEAFDHPQKNLITRALGVEEKVEADTSVIPIEAGDRILLCSDGLSDMVREDRIREVLAEHTENPETPSNILLEEALEAGGTDNITVVVVDVRERNDEEAAAKRNGTQEMPLVSASSAGLAAGTRASRRVRGGRKGRGEQGRSEVKSKNRRGKSGGIFGKTVRGVAVIALLLLVLTPAYAWGSTRYFLDESQDGEVVVYRGIPVTILGVSFNEQSRTTGVSLEDVNESSRDTIRENTLYTEENVNQVVSQLQEDAEQNRQEAERRESGRPPDQPGQNPRDAQGGGN